MPSSGHPQRRFLPFLILLLMNALLAIGCGSGSAPAPASGQSQFLSIAITSPTANSTVTGTVMITGSVTNPRSEIVHGVQFTLDGQNLNGEDTASPYSADWDTVAMPNGSHTLRAVVRYGVDLTRTSSPITVMVDNQVAPTLSLTPTSATVVLGGQEIFIFTTTGLPEPTLDCAPVVLGSLTLNPGSVTYDAPVSPPADFATNNTLAFTCTATNSAGSDSVLVTINLEYPVPEITSITPISSGIPGKLFCAREFDCLFKVFAIRGSGFYPDGVLHISPVFGDLVLPPDVSPTKLFFSWRLVLPNGVLVGLTSEFPVLMVRAAARQR